MSYSVNSRLHTTKKRPWIITVVIVAVLLLAGGGVWWRFHTDSVIPKNLQRQISFVIYAPTKPWQLPKSSISYSGSSGVLSFLAQGNGLKFTVTEQDAPSQFSDIPAYYPALLTKLNEYQTFGTPSGTVYLTQPTELNGQVEAVFYNDGTLLFVHSDTSVTLSQWRTFFNNLAIVK